MKFLLLSVLLFAVFSSASEVLVLDKSNFESTLEANEMILVEFYAPWCGHCKKLEPEYDSAAERLKGKVALGKVDATQNEDLAQKYEVQGFPTVFLFRKGSDKPKNYEGERSADAIVSYLERQSGAAVTVVPSVEEYKKFKESQDVVIIGTHAKGSKDEQLFKELAESLRDDFTFGAVTEADSKKHGITMHRKFDDGPVDFSGEASLESLQKFVRENSFRLVDEIGPSNYKGYLARELPIVWLFLDPKASNEASLELFKTVAKDFKGKTSFVHLDGVQYSGMQEKMGLSGQKTPTVALEHQEVHYAFDEEAEISLDSLKTWVSKVLAGEVKPTMRSQPIPTEAEENSVTVVVGENFDKIVNDPTKDVLIEFYAPWCGHCKALGPVYSKVAKHLKDHKVDSVVIAKMDATANDAPSVYKIQGFPTLYFVPASAEGKKAPQEYQGGRTSQDFVKFLRDSAVNKFECPDTTDDSDVKKDEESEFEDPVKGTEDDDGDDDEEELTKEDMEALKGKVDKDTKVEVVNEDDEDIFEEALGSLKTMLKDAIEDISQRLDKQEASLSEIRAKVFGETPKAEEKKNEEL